MNEDWNTPKTGGGSTGAATRPFLKPSRILSASVSPTLSLSEGPLTPAATKLQQAEKSPEIIDSNRQDEMLQIKAQMKQLSDIVHSRLSGGSNPDLNSEVERLKGENDRLQQTLEERLQTFQTDVVSLQTECRQETLELQNRVEQLLQAVQTEQVKGREMRRNYERALKEKASLKSYLQNLPAKEELSRLQEELNCKSESLRHSTSQVESLKSTLSDQSQKRLDLQSDSEQKDLLVQDLKLKLSKCEALNEAHLRRASEAKSMTMVDFQAVLNERDDLKGEVAKLKKYIALSQRKQKKEWEELNLAMEKKKSDLKSIKEDKEELTLKANCLQGTNGLLRDQVTNCHGQLKELRGKISVLENELYCRDNKTEIARDLEKMQVKLCKKAAEVIQELASVTSVSQQMVEGQDPNLSMLLGVSFSDQQQEEKEADTDEERLKKTQLLLQEIEKSKKTVAEIRLTLSENYAETVADRIMHL